MHFEGLTVTADYNGVTATISKQLEVLHRYKGQAELERHLSDFNRSTDEVRFYPITMDGKRAVGMTLYRHEGSIHAKTSMENYLPGTPSQLVRSHVLRMKETTDVMARRGNLILQDLLQAGSVEWERLDSGIYDFPYEAVSQILDQLAIFGLGPVTLGHTLDTIAGDNPVIKHMMGIAGIEPQWATDEQAEAIFQAATGAGVHPETAGAIMTMLDTGHQDNMLPTGSLAPEQAATVSKAMKDARFPSHTIEDVLHLLKEK